jgi:hypothetical protein
MRHIADVAVRPNRAKLDIPSIAKGGDYVKFTIATPETFAVTATGFVPA